MKDGFYWYIPPGEDEQPYIWEVRNNHTEVCRIEDYINVNDLKGQFVGPLIPPNKPNKTEDKKIGE